MLQTTPQSADAMSSPRTRAPSNLQDELNDLVLKLQALLPLPNSSSSSRSRSRCTNRVAASKIIKETCNYIKRLHREAEDLGERLSQLLASLENNGVDVDNHILTSLLQQ